MRFIFFRLSKPHVALAFAAVIGCAMLIVGVGSALLEDGTATQRAQPQVQDLPHTATPRASQSKVAENFSAIADWHLFGAYAGGDAPVADVAKTGRETDGTAMNLDDAPDTSLDLHLHGIVHGNQRQARAFIDVNNSTTEQKFAIGDEISRGVTVHAIGARHVLLNHNGKFEMLRLPRAELTQAPREPVAGLR